MRDGSYYAQFDVSVGGEWQHMRSSGPHSGLDLMMGVGTELYSISDGTVIVARGMGYTGYTVEVEDAEGFNFTYGHLSRIDVNEGDPIAMGAQIGLSGGAAGAVGAGNSTGPHLHLGVKNAAGTNLDPGIFISGTSAPSGLKGWQQLCLKECARQGCPADIALATVEAESSGENKTGDNGNALGYGQVWPRWNMQYFIQMGAELGISVPAGLPELTTLVLGNDQYSMAVAVAVIKANWFGSGEDWDKFTESYVGPSIPDADRERRRAIFRRYVSGYYDPAGTAQSSKAGDVGELGRLPKTQYQVVPGSVVNGSILYGRKYRIFVGDLAGDKALEVTNLHIKFTAVKMLIMAPQYSEIVIYNLSPQSENSIIKEGYRVVIYAGYEGGNFGTIFDGNVVQAVREKEDGHTYKLTLYAYDADEFMVYGTSNFTMLRGQNNRQFVQQLVNTSTVKAEIGTISDALAGQRLARGRAVFGKTADYIRQAACSVDAHFYTENGRLNLIKLNDLADDEVLEINPKSGLIGVPTQHEFGATIKMLMNPRVRIKQLVHVDNRLIRAQEYTTPGSAIYMLDQDGLYRVIKITYIGDTRGQDWYTELETVKQAGAAPDMQATSSTLIR